jgi:hypothetical protein
VVGFKFCVFIKFIQSGFKQRNVRWAKEAILSSKESFRGKAEGDPAFRANERMFPENLSTGLRRLVVGVVSRKISAPSKSKNKDAQEDRIRCKLKGAHLLWQCG